MSNGVVGVLPITNSLAEHKTDATGYECSLLFGGTPRRLALAASGFAS
jgi:hypothetical protein